MTTDHSPELAQKPVPAFIGLGALIASALIWLIYFKGKAEGPQWIGILPSANAFLNGLCAVCLGFGYYNIRRGNRVVHMRFMVAATIFSALFLTSYVTYHSFHGDTIFPGHGWIRAVYLSILGSHIILSIVALPMILGTLWYALRSQFRFHRNLSRWTFPIWLYVSVTGVIVYLMLRSYI